MNFDFIARHYRWLETIVFGNQLQHARTAFVRQIGTVRCALIVGEGNGRFLAELLLAHPEVCVDCIDASARMIARARKRVGARGANFIQADIREAPLPQNHYDLVVSHFFLDCFAGNELRAVIEKLARATIRDATWLLADFREPPNGWGWAYAQFWIRAMYAFFCLTSRIEATQLIDPSLFLRASGFVRRRQRLSRFGMIKSELWQRVA